MIAAAHIWLISAALTAPVPPDGAGLVTLRISPPLVELQVPPGGLHSFPIFLTNDGEKPQSVQASVKGLGLDEQGAPTILEESGEYSCAKWIKLGETRFELPAGGEHQVLATLRVPWGVRGGRYAVVLFRTEAGTVARGGTELTIGAITGTIVMETMPRTLHRHGAITEIGVAPLDEGGLQFGVHFANDGNCHVKASGTIVVRDENGRVAGRMPLEVGTGTVLPGITRVFPAVWEKRGGLPAGTFTAEARVSYEGGPPCRKSVVVKVTPPAPQSLAPGGGRETPTRAGDSGGAADRARVPAPS